MFNDIYQFDPSVVVWTDLTAKVKGQLPTPRAGAGLVSYHRMLYLFGGWDGEGEEAFLVIF